MCVLLRASVNLPLALTKYGNSCSTTVALINDAAAQKLARAGSTAAKHSFALFYAPWSALRTLISRLRGGCGCFLFHILRARRTVVCDSWFVAFSACFYRLCERAAFRFCLALWLIINLETLGGCTPAECTANEYCKTDRLRCVNDSSFCVCVIYRHYFFFIFNLTNFALNWHQWIKKKKKKTYLLFVKALKSSGILSEFYVDID